MDWIHTLQIWEKGELLQGKIMIGIGVMVAVATLAIVLNHSAFLRGALLPLVLLAATFISYGGYVVYSRPIHVEQSIARYQSAPDQASEAERQKHLADNQFGNTMLRTYPVLIILAMVALMLLPNPFYKGMAVGFALLFLSTYIMDTGFVARSNTVLTAITNTPSGA